MGSRIPFAEPRVLFLGACDWLSDGVVNRGGRPKRGGNRAAAP